MYACAIDRVILVGAAAKPRDLNSQFFFKINAPILIVNVENHAKLLYYIHM